MTPEGGSVKLASARRCRSAKIDILSGMGGLRVLAPKILEPRWSQFSVPDRMLDILVAEISLQRPRSPCAPVQSAKARGSAWQAMVSGLKPSLNAQQPLPCVFLTAPNGNNRIRKARFLNQNSPGVPNAGKMFFAPRPKIALQHIPPESGHSGAWRECFHFVTFPRSRLRRFLSTVLAERQSVAKD